MPSHDSNLDSDNDRTHTVAGGPERVINSLLETREHAPSSGKRVEVSTDRGESTPTPLQISLPPKYTFKGWLGRGGMGEVVHAFDNELKRHVAIKFMRSKAAASVFARRRFLEEAHILAQMHHPNVVDVFEKGEVDGEPYFVMAYLDGYSLAERREEFRTSAARAVGVMIAVAIGVQHAHEKGVCHRDLKASNVMFDAGRPLVVDFGCARWDEAEVSTQGFALLGTPSHMAPEVFELGSKEHDERADLWSLGVMLYLLLSGELPFGSDQRSPEGRARLLNDDPTPIRSHPAAVPGVDDRLEELVRKALAKNPAERQQTAAEFAAELEAWLAAPAAVIEEVVPVPTEPPAKPKRRWRWLVATGVAAVALLGVSAAAMWPKTDKLDRPQPTEPTPPTTLTLTERLTKPGKWVDFIGETGLPTERTTTAENTSGTIEVSKSGHCELAATRNLLVDLGELTFDFPVRFEAEVRLSLVWGDTKAGLFWDRKAHLQPTSTHAHALNVCCFGPISKPPAGPDWANKWGAITEGARFNPADSSPLFFATHSARWQPWLIPTKDRDSGETPFTTVVIDIYPSAKFAGRLDGKLLPADDRVRAERGLKMMFDFNQEAVQPPLFGHRFGLFVLQGNGQFRKVRLTRLAD